MNEENPQTPKLRMAETPEEQRQRMAQWRSAEKALIEVKREELRALTDADVLANCDLLLADADPFYVSHTMKPPRGFVEPQHIFIPATPPQ